MEKIAQDDEAMLYFARAHLCLSAERVLGDAFSSTISVIVGGVGVVLNETECSVSRVMAHQEG